MERSDEIISEAKEVFDLEIAALTATRDALDGAFPGLVRLVLNCRGKVILSGVGKPGYIAGKIASTLSSLGTPALFLHPTEAGHGSLGLVGPEDLVVLLSYSGESREVTGLLPRLGEIGCVTVAVTGRGNSTLAMGCEERYVLPSFREAGPPYPAPTASTTALLALGDALAVTVARARGFSQETFCRNHPAGVLGRNPVPSQKKEESTMKRVITYGTFDLLHYGHINLLRRAKALGDYLIVALSTDEFNANEKQKYCYFPYEKRKALLEAIRYVDLVIPEENWDQKRTDVHEYHIDTFVIGDDWTGKFDFLKDEGVEVVYLPRTPEISTTQIKADLNREKKD